MLARVRKNVENLGWQCSTVKSLSMESNIQDRATPVEITHVLHSLGDVRAGKECTRVYRGDPEIGNLNYDYDYDVLRRCLVALFRGYTHFKELIYAHQLGSSRISRNLGSITYPYFSVNERNIFQDPDGRTDWWDFLARMRSRAVKLRRKMISLYR